MRLSLYHLVHMTPLVTISSAQFPSKSLVAVSSYTGCPPEGPLLPRPTNVSNSKHFQAAADQLTSLLDSTVAGNIKAGWDVENVSFSLAVVSPNGSLDENTGMPIWEYHHRGKKNNKGTSNVTGDSQYLVGSVSKALSVAVLLKSRVDIRDPVTKFLPELRSKESLAGWEDITLEALAEHLAGVPPNCMPISHDTLFTVRLLMAIWSVVYEFSFMQPLFERLGFPVLNQSDYPPCGVSGMNDACNEQRMSTCLKRQ